MGSAQSGATRDDVARRAGTSTAVVSYVVNGGPRPVAAATRARVLDAIAALNYRPNRIAQALSARRSFVLGLVLPDSANPYFASLAREVERAAAARGYMLLLANTDREPALELRHIEALLQRRVDGLFLISASNGAASAELLAASGAPFVLLDRLSRSRHAPVVRSDNARGSYRATRPLLALGHRRIAHVAGPRELVGARERAAGYRAAMREAGLLPLPEVWCDYDPGRACAAGHAMLSVPGRPSAIVAGSDVQALGLLRAAADLGIAVPGGLAVVGFDGIAEAEYTVPRLTTVAQPIAAMAAFATAHLVGAIEHPGSARRLPGRVHTLQPRLVIRESCGAAVAGDIKQVA